MYPVYYVVEGDTLPILFDTFAGSTGASVTMSGLAVTDIEIYKDGSTTQRSSDAGYTLLDTDGIDFDGLTGIHGFSIDLSDNTDAGFFTVGPWYHVVVSAITIDSQTVSFIAAAFRIVSATRGLAGTALPDAAADAAGGLPISDAGGLDLDAQIGTKINDILTDTGTTLDGKIDTIDTNVDSILDDTGTSGVVLANDAITSAKVADSAWQELIELCFTYDATANYAGAQAGSLVKEIADNAGGSALTAAAIADAVWDEAQADHVAAGSFGEIATEIASILVDTAEIGAAGAGLTEAGGTGDHLTAIPWNAAWDAEVQSEVNDGLVAFWTSPTTLVDLVWDEVITGGAHNVNNSAAKFLRESAEVSLGDTGTAQAGAATTITLAAGASALDDYYNGELVTIIEGTGVGQSRLVMDYNGTTKVATVSHAWITNPDATSVYAVMGAEADIRAVAEQAVTATASVDFDDLAAILDDTDLIDDGTSGLAKIATDVAAILVDTGTTLQAELDGIQADTEDIQSRLPAALVGGRIDATVDGTGMEAGATAAIAAAVFTTAMTESYRSAGAAGTLAQYVHEIVAHLGEFAISGTTKTTKKLDGSTTAKTYTLNDATSPTSITEAT